MTTILINGSRQEVDADPSTPLLWVIRDHLGLTGTKFGCGMAMCGACTVHLNGEPIRSCVTPLSAVADNPVTTIESLAGTTSDGKLELHPLQQAWLNHDVVQCGYCHSGQLMSAAALLRDNQNPSDEAVDQAMSGNICRCGTYSRIRAAIHDAAETMREG